ncbi:MAG: peptide deformylase [Dehalococcoidales bacterium]|nr:peptide deformylase [Dehalococcoidales bacterium]
MAVLQILTVPDPVLRQKAKQVKVIGPSVKKLIKNMCETLHDAPGVGLAAPQVGSSLRVIVISVPEEEEDIVLVNPEIVKTKGERICQEGCLSVPGYIGEVIRAEKVTAKGKNAGGKEIRIRAEGLLAEALEHEIDHLNGVLYIDKLDSPDKLHKLQPSDMVDEEDTVEI